MNAPALWLISFKYRLWKPRAVTGFNVELLFRMIAKDLYVEDLDKRRQDGDLDIEDEEREERKIVKVLKLKTTGQKKPIPKKRNTFEYS